MIKKIAWDTFKNTGDINTFLELKQIEDIERGIKGRTQIPFQEGNGDTPINVEQNEKNL